MTSPSTSATNKTNDKTVNDHMNKNYTLENSTLKEVIKPWEDAVPVEVYGNDDNNKTVVKTKPLEAEIKFISTTNSETRPETETEEVINEKKGFLSILTSVLLLKLIKTKLKRMYQRMIHLPVKCATTNVKR